MSSDYRLGLIWTSHGGQLRADLERNIGGLTSFDKRLRGSSREMGLWGQQMKAIGTTIRYALAGATVYAVAGAVGGLAQFRDRLGEIDSLAAELDSRGRLQSLGRGLNEVGDMALLASNKWGIAVDDIEQHMVRFYSAGFKGLKGQESIKALKDYTEAMGQLSLIAEGSDPQLLGGGVASMIIGATPHGQTPDIKRQSNRMVDIIAQVLSQTPTLTGRDISRDIGRLSAAQTAINMTPEEIFAVYGLAAKGGGSGMVIGRGVTQLLAAEIGDPKDQQKKAFRQAGLPTDPGALREMGGIAILKQMMRAVAPGGASFKNAGVLGLEGLADEEAVGAAGATGVNMKLLTGLFGRQESQRQFLNIMANGGIPALEEFIEGIKEADRVNRGKQQADLRREQRTLLIMQQAQKNLAITFMRGVDPILNPLARAVTSLSTRAIEAGPTATAGIVGGAAAASLASRMIFGAGLIGATGQGVMKIPGVGRALNKMPFLKGIAGRAPQLAAASLIGAGPGIFSSTGIPTQTAGGVISPGSRENPFWVVIDPLSWAMPGAPLGGGGVGSEAAVAGAVGRRGLAAALALTGASAALLASPVASQLALEYENKRRVKAGTARGVGKGHPLLEKFTSRARGTGFFMPEDRSDAEQSILSAFTSKSISADEAERRLQSLSRGGRGAGGGTGLGFVSQVYGEAGMTITLEPSPELLPFIREITGRRVTAKLQPVAAGQRPQFRGQDKTRRGGTR